MTSRPEILDEIMFYILERAKCEEETDKYLEHVFSTTAKRIINRLLKRGIKFYSLQETISAKNLNKDLI